MKGKNEPSVVNDQEWVTKLLEAMRPWVKEQLAEGQAYPERERVRLSFLSSGRRAGQVMGEAFLPNLSDDQTVEYMIRIDQDEPPKLAVILLKFMIHAVAGDKLSEDVKALAWRVGFDNRYSFKNPVPNAILAKKIENLVDSLGPIPFKRLRYEEGKVIGRPRKQKARLISCSCEAVMEDGKSCGCTAQSTRLWLKNEKYGAPARGRPATGAGTGKRASPAVKYQGPNPLDQWSGRGRLPRWLVAQEAEGRSRDEFLIKS